MFDFICRIDFCLAIFHSSILVFRRVTHNTSALWAIDSEPIRARGVIVKYILLCCVSVSFLPQFLLLTVRISLSFLLVFRDLYFVSDRSNKDLACEQAFFPSLSSLFFSPHREPVHRLIKIRHFSLVCRCV